MRVALDVAMSGRRYRVFSLLCLVTRFFGFMTSKDRGLCGRVLCMMFMWLDGVCLWLGVGCSIVVVFLVAQRWHLGRMLWGLYVVCVVFKSICFYR